MFIARKRREASQNSFRSSMRPWLETLRRIALLKECGLPNFIDLAINIQPLRGCQHTFFGGLTDQPAATVLSRVATRPARLSV